MATRLKIKVSEPSGPLVGLASLLAVSFIVGLIGGGLWSSVGQEGIRENDYLVMVSLLYERDRSVPNAVERLDVLEKSEIAGDVAALADSYPQTRPEAQTEARALRQLATALNKSSGEGQAESTSEDEGSSGGIWLALGFALVSVCFLGIAGPFALRFASSTRRGFALPFMLPWSKGSKGSKAHRRSGSSIGRKSGRRPVILAGNEQMASRAPQPAVEESAAIIESANGESMPGESAPAESIPIETQPSRSDADYQFQSRFEFGEDPYDEIHPVTDRESGALIGACGLSAELKLSDDIPGHYYAFSFWAHDYVSDSNLRRIALVSKWAKSKAPAELVRWTERSRADEVVVANPGMRLLIDTASLAVDVHITSFRYGTDAEAPPDAYFSSLTATFEIKIKNSAGIS